MKKSQKVDLYVHPSFFSMMLSFGVLCYLIATNVWLWARGSAIVEQISKIYETRITKIGTASNSSTFFSDAVSQSSFLNELFYLLAWACVGILCYFAYLMVSSGLQGFKELITPRSKVGAKEATRFHEVAAHLAIRVLVAIALILYSVLFFQILLPVVVSCLRASATLDSESLFYLAIGSIVFLLSMHLYTILLRVFMLRVRVFGGGEDLTLSQLR